MRRRPEQERHSVLQTKYPALKKYVFIVTYGRSGSTLLQNLLNALPGALVRGENEYLLGPLARAWSILRHSEQQAKMHRERKISSSKDPWFGFENVSSEALGASLSQSFLETVLRPEADTRITGFKEIRWHHDPLLFPEALDFLRTFFPRARIIINTRDHDQVIRSGWWKEHSPDHVRRQLEHAERLYDAYAQKHPSSCLRMHYNSYIQGPDAWHSLFRFLEEPFDAKLVTAALDNKLTHLKSWK
jgi:hypothetical protein